MPASPAKPHAPVGARPPRAAASGRRVGVRARILLIGLMGLLGIFGVGGIAVVNALRMSDAAARVQHIQGVRDAMQQLRYDNGDVSGWEAFYAWDTRRLGPKEAVAQPAEKDSNRAGFEAAVKRTREHLAAMPTDLFDDADRAQWQRMQQGWNQFFAADDRAVKAYATGTDAGVEAGDAIIDDDETPGTAASAYDIVEGAVTALLASLDTKAQAAEDDSAAALRAMLVAIGVGLVLFPVLLIFIALRTSGRIRDNVNEVLGSVDALGRGDLTVPATASSNDELGDMATGVERARTSMRELIASVRSAAADVESANRELDAESTGVGEASGEASRQVSEVLAATEEVGSHVQTVAAGNEEMTASIQEIARNTQEAADVAARAVAVADSTTTTISTLGDSSAQIGQVINAITGIAEQTNLLALNATIEAARAGEAGKGFAVVANEVKELARETSEATEDITVRIAAIQADTQAAVAAITQISGIITSINDSQATIAAAVEEQTATTNEMGRNARDAADGSTRITARMGELATVSGRTSASAQRTQDAAARLADRSTQLTALVDRFVT